MDHQLLKTQICQLQITLNKSEGKASINLILLNKFSIPSPTGESPVGDGIEVKNIFVTDEKCRMHRRKLRQTRSEIERPAAPGHHVRAKKAPEAGRCCVRLSVRLAARDAFSIKPQDDVDNF
jgi:hypothetical protein